MISTTNQMDSITPEERPLLIGQCPECSNWTKFNSNTDKKVCKADGTPLDGRTIQSQRSFTVVKKGKIL